MNISTKHLLKLATDFEHLKASYSLNHHAILLYTDSGNHLSSSLEGIEGSEKTQVHESILWKQFTALPTTLGCSTRNFFLPIRHIILWIYTGRTKCAFNRSFLMPHINALQFPIICRISYERKHERGCDLRFARPLNYFGRSFKFKLHSWAKNSLK